jgi:hypothetical protein
VFTGRTKRTTWRIGVALAQQARGRHLIVSTAGITPSPAAVLGRQGFEVSPAVDAGCWTGGVRRRSADTPVNLMHGKPESVTIAPSAGLPGGG